MYTTNKIAHDGACDCVHDHVDELIWAVLF